MNNFKLIKPLIVALCFLTLYSQELFAQLVVCDPDNPCTVSGAVTPGVNANVMITWRGYAFVERGTGLSSDAGRFMTTGNRILGTHSQLLQQALMPNATGEAVGFQLNESVQVPQDVLTVLASLGEERLVYTRMFFFEGVTATASVMIDINQRVNNARDPASFNRSLSLPDGSEPGATALAIRRIQLQFNSGSQVEVINTNQNLHVLATVNFDRAGLLDAVWEIATPGSTLGVAVFRPLANVRQYLAGGGQIALQSPMLPADVSGLYRVRLRLNTPEIDQAPVELRYQVIESAITVEPHIIQQVDPAPGAEINAKSIFRWPAQTGAEAYQIEIYAQPESEKPIAGLLLNADRVQSPLSLSALNNIAGGDVYYWRVIALDRAGNIIAASELRKFQLRQ